MLLICIAQFYVLFTIFCLLLDVLVDVPHCVLMQKCVPIYKTMFSDLRRYPRHEVRLDTVDPVPRFIARQWRGQQTECQEDALLTHRLIPSWWSLQMPVLFVDSKLRLHNCVLCYFC